MAKVLRAYLVLVFLANLGGLAVLAIDLEGIRVDYPRLDNGLVALLFVAGVASLVAVVLIWRWHRAGLYLVTAAYAVMLAVNLHYGAPRAHTVLSPIGLAILYVLVWPLRKRFGERGE
jgi:hypothetical protein